MGSLDVPSESELKWQTAASPKEHLCTKLEAIWRLPIHLLSVHIWLCVYSLKTNPTCELMLLFSLHSKAAFIRFCVPRITVLKHGCETRSYRRAFIRVFSRACFWLSRTVPLRISFCAACPLAKDQTGRALWCHLNRVWNRCCVYKIFKTMFL